MTGQILKNQAGSGGGGWGSFSAFPNSIIANGHLYLLSHPMQQLPNKEGKLRFTELIKEIDHSISGLVSAKVLYFHVTVWLNIKTFSINDWAGADQSAATI